jgi:hypothetical protein
MMDRGRTLFRLPWSTMLSLRAFCCCADQAGIFVAAMRAFFSRSDTNSKFRERFEFSTKFFPVFDPFSQKKVRSSNQKMENSCAKLRSCRTNGERPFFLTPLLTFLGKWCQLFFRHSMVAISVMSSNVGKRHFLLLTKLIFHSSENRKLHIL